MEVDEEATQPPEDNLLPTDCLNQSAASSPTIEVDSSEGGSQPVTEEDENKLKFDIHFDPFSSSPVKPLNRLFRKEIKEKIPYYTPEGISCCSYTAVIIQLFKTYRQRLLKAQARSKTTIPWGKAVQPGHHFSKTIDAKKRGCVSVDFDSSSDEHESEVSKIKSPVRKLSPVPQKNRNFKISKSSKEIFPPFLSDAHLSKTTHITKTKTLSNNRNPEKNSQHIRFNDDGFNSDEYEGQTQAYNENDLYVNDNDLQIDDNSADSDFVPEKESSKARRGKQKTTRKPKKHPVEVKEVKTDSACYINDFEIECIPDSSSNSKDSFISRSQGSNEIINSQGDIYSTQVPEQKRAKKPGRKPAAPKPKQPKNAVSENIKRKISESSDDEMLIEHLKDSNKKRRKVNIDFNQSRNEDLFQELEAKSKVSKTYSKKERKKKIEHEMQSVDFDQLLAVPILKYVPDSQSSQSSQNLQDPIPTIILDDEDQYIPPSPEKEFENSANFISHPVTKKRKPFSLFRKNDDSDDEFDKILLKRTKEESLKSLKTVEATVKPLRQSEIDNMNYNYNNQNDPLLSSDRREDNSVIPSTSRVQSQAENAASTSRSKIQKVVPTFWNRQENVNVVSPQRADQRKNIVSPQRSDHSSQPLAPDTPPSSQTEIAAAEEEELVECPLCGSMFSFSLIERHASSCGDEDQLAVPMEEPRELEIDEPTRHTRSKSNRM